MSKAKKYSLVVCSGFKAAGLLLFAFSLAVALSAQQNPPVLQITSPTDSTVVNPGQTVSVTVTSPASASFSEVGVIGEDPIGFSSIAESVPAQFSMAIPTDIACRKFMLTAVGATSSGQSAQSAPILIDVERPDMPTALSAQIPKITFEALGEQFPLVLLATFSDGSILDVTRSTYVTYSSSDTTIATVDANGMVTGVGVGNATVMATYELAGQIISATTPITAQSLGLSVAPASLSFASQNVGTSSSAQQLTVVNTSNSDMKIVSVSATGDFFETDTCVSSSPLSVNGACVVNVTFVPSGVGVRQGAISIANGTIGIPSTIALTGTGIGQPTTTTAVTSSANPSVWGQSITLTATVSPSSGTGTATGTVTFSEGTSTLGTEPLTNGQATFTSSSLSVGSHSITANYSGDGTFEASTGSLTQTVNPASTSTTVTSSANPSILNGSFTLTANIAVVAPGSGTPSGTITFKDGSTILSTVTISSSGQATFSSSSLAAGAHSIATTYSGDSNFNGSTSATLTQKVQYEPAGTTCDGDAGHQILQPISADGSSVFKQGQTVPAKFRVCDANGVSVGAAGVVSSFLLTQTVSGIATTNVEDIVDTNNPDTMFRWDATDQQWIFNISTQNLAADSTYVYTISLSDGTVINFQFGLQ